METFSLSRADLLPLPFNSFVFVERIHGSPQLALCLVSVGFSFFLAHLC